MLIEFEEESTISDFDLYLDTTYIDDDDFQTVMSFFEDDEFDNLDNSLI